jgi:ABC-type Mn2+/Zn2+ transport system permease subunit
MISLLSSRIFLITIVGASLAGIACSLMGVFVVRMKLSSLGFCMSHAAFAGSALGLVLSFNPLLMALIFSTLIAFILGPLAEKARLNTDVILGVLFSLTMSLGLIFLNLAPETAMSSTAMSILWGSILGMSSADVTRLAILTVIVVVLMILFSKEFRAIMFDRKMAEASGIPTKPFYYLILFLTGITVSLSLKLIGGLLIFALLVSPASTAYQFFHDIRKIIIFAPIFGVGSCLTGILISFLLDLPVGSSIAIVSSLLFGIAVIFSPKRRKG